MQFLLRPRAVAKILWCDRAKIIFNFMYQIYLHGENVKIMEIQSKIEEFCQNVNKNF